MANDLVEQGPALSPRPFAPSLSDASAPWQLTWSPLTTTSADAFCFPPTATPPSLPRSIPRDES